MIGEFSAGGSQSNLLELRFQSPNSLTMTSNTFGFPHIGQIPYKQSCWSRLAIRAANLARADTLSVSYKSTDGMSTRKVCGAIGGPIKDSVGFPVVPLQ